MSKLAFQILGIGAWGPGFRNWPELSAMLNAPEVDSEEVLQTTEKGPKPGVIPANERRRAPLPVRLAVETSWQAVQDAQLEPADLPCVFVSGIGDTQLTDYMCRVVAGDNKALSPTKFHNSVHNAAAGYWTISTGCMQAANSVAGFQESVPLTLVEALIQCQAKQKPILITFYDAPSSAVLRELLENQFSFSVSIVIAPPSWSEGQSVTVGSSYQAQIENKTAAWPPFSACQLLEKCYTTNPVAKILSLLKIVASPATDAPASVSMPLSAQSRFTITTDHNLFHTS